MTPTDGGAGAPARARFGRDGAAVIVDADLREDLDAVAAILPDDWRVADAADLSGWRLRALRLRAQGDGRTILRDDVAHFAGDPGDAIEIVRAVVQRWCAEHARERVYVHAAAVAIDGAVLLLPAPSGAGKSTLTHALLRRGARYLSDEFAVLDIDGTCHPCARPLRLRTPTGWTSVSTRDLASPALSPRWCVALRYAPEVAGLRVERCSRGNVALELVRQTAAMRSAPQLCTDVIAEVSRRCVGWTGLRGEAEDAADALLTLLRTSREA